MGLDEGPELFAAIPEEEGCEIYLRVYVPVTDGIPAEICVVVKIGAWKEFYVPALNRFIVVLKGHRIGPGLVGWVCHIVLTAADKGPDKLLFRFCQGFFPLLELDYDDIVPAFRGCARDYEVYAL